MQVTDKIKLYNEDCMQVMALCEACHDYKFSLVGCEIAKDYYEGAVKRFKQHISQQVLF